MNNAVRIMNREHGFTLIELVVVIGILSVLSIMALATINPFAQFQKSDDARRKADLSQVQKALEQYYQDHQQYPLNSGNYEIEDFQGTEVAWGSTTGGWQPYMNILPKDPMSPQRTYAYFSNGQSYWLYASLERGTLDSASCGIVCPSIAANNIPASVCGSGKQCNFSLHSPNVTTP